MGLGQGIRSMRRLAILTVMVLGACGTPGPPEAGEVSAPLSEVEVRRVAFLPPALSRGQDRALASAFGAVLERGLSTADLDRTTISPVKPIGRARYRVPTLYPIAYEIRFDLKGCTFPVVVETAQDGRVLEVDDAGGCIGGA